MSLRRLLLGLTVASAFALPATGQTPYVWVQLVDQDKVSVRAVTSGTCDQIATTLAMTERKPPDNAPGSPFDRMEMQGNTVCEHIIDLTAYSEDTVTIENATIALPKSAPRRVVILGDTGCRKLHASQSCDPYDWGFPTAIAAIEPLKPDLMVHVGDYVYRRNCGPYHGQQSHEGCGSHHELREWSYWQSDFFDPAQPILPLAPWVFVRGNHEDCVTADRGWRGWSLLLSMETSVTRKINDCVTNKLGIAAPITLSLPASSGAPALTLLAYDTADEKQPTYTDLGHDLQGVSAEAWILTHVPLMGNHGSEYVQAPANTAGYRSGLPPAVNLILSGHVHYFDMLQFAESGAVQLIVGGSGTKLDAGFGENNLDDDFSFAVLDRDTNGATLTVCAVPRTAPYQVRAWKSWTVAFSPQSGTTLTKTDTQTAACLKPAA